MNIERLLDILTLKRGHNSVGERKLVEQLFVPTSKGFRMLTDPQGTPLVYFKAVGTSSTPSPILWTCHIDTVHNNSEDAKQMVAYDAGTDMVYKQDGKPLGGDDGAGVWLLLEMIDAGVPGTYAFFRGEEKGGIGSSGVAQHHTDWLKAFRYAIAFDRRDTCSVITHQGRGRCCSDEFARGLADLLSDDNYSMRPDAGGIYTDTAEFMGIIPECTNVSIGYYNEHSKDEILDVAYVKWLRERVILQADLIHQLPVKRDPTAIEPRWDGFEFGGYRGHYDPYGWESIGTALTTTKSQPKRNSTYLEAPTCAEEILDMRFKELVRWIKHAPEEEVADLLLDLATQVEWEQTKEQYNN